MLTLEQTIAQELTKLYKGKYIAIHPNSDASDFKMVDKIEIYIYDSSPDLVNCHVEFLDDTGEVIFITIQHQLMPVMYNKINNDDFVLVQ